MALGRAFSVAVRGLDAALVEIEADITSGLPGVHLVGLPDAALQESRDRVRAAITNCGNSWPMARLTLALWAAVLLTAAPNFIYYVNGFAQFGMRHALDFEPFLVALMALGLRDRMPAWCYALAYTLIGWSCAVGLWGCWYWNTFIRTSN